MKVIEWLRIFLIVPFLVDMSVQQCAIDSFKANVTNIIASTEVIDVLQFITINCTYYNCLSSSQTVGLYLTMTLSVLFTKESTPNVTNEARYSAQCFRGLWSMSGDSIATALRDNNTRINCSSCLDQSVNDYQCSRK